MLHAPPKISSILPPVFADNESEGAIQFLRTSPPMPGNLGFLTVSDQAPFGLTGGFLVLNRAGRPLEFHCTVPLQPEKIQQILYGNTLQPFLYGERIAQTLIQRSKTPVFAILTDHAAVLPVQSLVTLPIIYVFGGRSEQKNDDSLPEVREISPELNESLKTFGINSPHLRTRSVSSDEIPQIPNIPGLDTEIWKEVRIGNRLIAVPGAEEKDREQLSDIMKNSARTIDLLEPFDRIRLALDEAKNVA